MWIPAGLHLKQIASPTAAVPSSGCAEHFAQCMQQPVHSHEPARVSLLRPDNGLGHYVGGLHRGAEKW
eukprot:1158134-Pelagomonas_calceolata.AAC.3